ncbi:hypothetical protein M501DRAFT_997818 [Patellaria atrata CBS 101060]|uniref:Uncharacterized protein n=1 Tax=Patellaria atrata CBS 101060 TaxID=1346257 RepID=A0A9P4VNG6_9PEZI|nr:hypothetical protein M501DRAFT_997818 [Patellaria atrata CBS 101060]
MVLHETTNSGKSQDQTVVNLEDGNMPTAEGITEKLLAAVGLSSNEKDDSKREYSAQGDDPLERKQQVSTTTPPLVGTAAPSARATSGVDGEQNQDGPGFNSAASERNGDGPINGVKSIGEDIVSSAEELVSTVIDKVVEVGTSFNEVITKTASEAGKRLREEESEGLGPYNNVATSVPSDMDPISQGLPLVSMDKEVTELEPAERNTSTNGAGGESDQTQLPKV